MPAITIKKFENIVDFAAHNAGNTNALLSIAAANNVSITDDVAPGTLLNYIIESALPKNYYTPAATVVSTAFKHAIKRFQTPLDFATQFGGDADTVINMCQQNNISITDDVAPGTILNYTQEDANTAAYFTKRLFDIITGVSMVSAGLLEGIGYWWITEPEPATVVE